MANRYFPRAIPATLLVLGISLGCTQSSPSIGPSPTPTRAALTVTSVLPNAGPAGRAGEVRILGTGFQPGATLTLDGAATNVNVVSSVVINATTPIHAAGSVDVVVTNPDGQSARLSDGYTYAVFTLSVSSNVMTPGSEMTVRWVAPSGRPALDWVGLFRAGSPNTSYGWYEYTNGATSGTLRLTAPTQTGQYEFRYLLDDGFVDVARSGQVTVTAGGN